MLALIVVKVIHSVAFWIIQTAIFYLLYKGIKAESDKKAVAAGAIAIGESLIYAANGFRCPLTGLAERLGAQSGSVTDLFLPRWLAANVANIYTPMLAAALILHARNLGRSRCPPGNRRPSGENTAP